MIYIPDEWLKNKENEEEVRRLLCSVIGCIKFSSTKDKNEAAVFARLKELGEEKILQEWENGNFSM